MCTCIAPTVVYGVFWNFFNFKTTIYVMNGTKDMFCEYLFFYVCFLFIYIYMPNFFYFFCAVEQCVYLPRYGRLSKPKLKSKPGTSRRRK